ncbi:retrovirus-related pol polyprotein from transposon TNT 1-94, partial [Tanacetum coccineum]
MDKCILVGTSLEHKAKPSKHDEVKKSFYGRVYDKTFEDCKEDPPLHLRSMLKEIHMEQEDATKIYVGNKSAIDLAKNPVYHDRSKHINTRYHYIQECIARKDVRVIHTSSEDQVTDIFTKPLNAQDFSRQRMMLGVGKSSLEGVLDCKLDLVIKARAHDKEV